MTNVFPLPGVDHGHRFAPSVIDELARTEPLSTWASVPVDDTDLSKGYREISYSQLANYANHAAQWLSQTLPLRPEPFQKFAYAGPKDLRYPILAVAAAKLDKVMLLPSPLMTPEALARLLSKTSCTTYIRPQNISATVDVIAAIGDKIQVINAPELSQITADAPTTSVSFDKEWESNKDDPWLIFHTSGTTGDPKPITYTHHMMAVPDIAAGLDGIGETNIHQYTYKRWYMPLPLLHFVGMLMALPMATYLRTTLVIGPVSAPPTPQLVKTIIQNTQVDGVILPPSLIDSLCLDPVGLSTLRGLKHIHYTGASLSLKSGQLLSNHARLAPLIGSTEAGAYFVKFPSSTSDWDYVAFQPQAGAVFEPRLDDLHELVFIRRPEYEPMQSIFRVYPDRDRHPTSDLWIEHPTKKGLWKIVGRTDDYVSLAHGDGLHASTLELEIEQHPEVQAALIGGHARPKPVVLVELIPEAQYKAEDELSRKELIESLEPYLERANSKCHASVRLDPAMVVIARKEKPLERTIKESVARLQSLKLYEPEIERAYQRLD